MLSGQNNIPQLSGKHKEKHRTNLLVSDLYLLSSTGMKSMSRTYSAAGSIPEIRTWNVGNILLQICNYKRAYVIRENHRI